MDAQGLLYLKRCAAASARLPEPSTAAPWLTLACGFFNCHVVLPTWVRRHGSPSHPPLIWLTMSGGPQLAGALSLAGRLPLPPVMQPAWLSSASTMLSSLVPVANVACSSLWVDAN